MVRLHVYHDTSWKNEWAHERNKIIQFHARYKLMNLQICWTQWKKLIFFHESVFSLKLRFCVEMIEFMFVLFDVRVKQLRLRLWDFHICDLKSLTLLDWTSSSKPSMSIIKCYRFFYFMWKLNPLWYGVVVVTNCSMILALALHRWRPWGAQVSQFSTWWWWWWWPWSWWGACACAWE